MKFSEKSMRLYAVTDRTWTKSKTLIEQVALAINGGITCVQLREKDMNEAGFLKEALEIKSICNNSNVPFIINDNVDIAVKCGADGIHVGQTDMSADNIRDIVGSSMIIGVSASTVSEAIKAEAAGADYLGVGAVFATTTKLDAAAVSHSVIRDICNAVSIPVVAIGGINKSNIMELSGTGVAGVALVSAIFAADDIENECRTLLSLSESMVAV